MDKHVKKTPTKKNICLFLQNISCEFPKYVPEIFQEETPEGIVALSNNDKT